MAKKENDDHIENETLEAASQESATLTEKEKLAIEAEVRAEIAKELKAAAKKDFKAAAKLRIQAETMFRSGRDDSGEDLDTIDLQLASYPKFIMLDGTVYHSGKKYTKKKSVIAVLKDQMDRGWRQEAARLGEKMEMVAQRRTLVNRYGTQIQ